VRDCPWSMLYPQWVAVREPGPGWSNVEKKTA